MTGRPALNLAGLIQYVDRFPSARIVVVGDLMLDHYIWGQVTRVSPEAPVPVVEVREESHRLGGAANVAHNVTALDGAAVLCGAIGDDEAGRNLRSLLEKSGVGAGSLIVEADRPTTVKTRVLAHQQQIVRVDRETTRPLAPNPTSQRLFGCVEQALSGAHCLVISDYAKGVLSEGFLKDVIQLARRFRVPVVADPKVNHFDAMKGATVATPNHLEARQIAAGRVKSADDIMEVGRHLLDRLDGEAVLITLGERGMALFQREQPPVEIPTVARQVFDVTGAGDTV
ncbi:MAG: PfkB family carbohydrate kinase, partial [Nitrospirota bacterium]